MILRKLEDGAKREIQSENWIAITPIFSLLRFLGLDVIFGPRPGKPILTKTKFFFDL